MDVGRVFIDRSRAYLSTEYLPKIRRSMQGMSQEDLWWRPNPASNSLGNLVLHLAGNVSQWVVSGIGGEEDVRRREEEFSRVDECDPDVVFFRPSLQEWIVGLWPEHAAGWTDQEIGAAVAQSLDQIRVSPVGANHQRNLAIRCLEHRRTAPGGVAYEFVPELLLAILADESTVGGDQNRRVVTVLAVSLQHPGYKKDIQLVGQSCQPAAERAIGDTLAERSVLLHAALLIPLRKRKNPNSSASFIELKW